MVISRTPLSNVIHVGKNLLQQFMNSNDREGFTSLVLSRGENFEV
jgi:hypothetical protein